jgi:predicted amidophosphoribosyltransferase
MRKKSVSPKAFAIAPTFVAKHVLVIEDVVTTGQTIQAFTQALKMHGVSTVEIWSVCRTSL